MKDILRFMASKNGRIARIVAGILIIVIGVVAVQETLGWVLVVIGLIPILAGALDYCLLAPLAGLPLKGADLREKLG